MSNMLTIKNKSNLRLYNCVFSLTLTYRTVLPTHPVDILFLQIPLRRKTGAYKTIGTSGVQS